MSLEGARHRQAAAIRSLQLLAGDVARFATASSEGARVSAAGWLVLVRGLRQLDVELTRVLAELEALQRGRVCAGPDCDVVAPETARADWRFCSPRCRVRAHRAAETARNGSAV